MPNTRELFSVQTSWGWCAYLCKYCNFILSYFNTTRSRFEIFILVFLFTASLSVTIINCELSHLFIFFFFSFLRYVTNPDFDPNNIRSVSSACEGLCRWVRAMEVYERVAKVGSLKPLWTEPCLFAFLYFSLHYQPMSHRVSMGIESSLNFHRSKQYRLCS